VEGYGNANNKKCGAIESYDTNRQSFE